LQVVADRHGNLYINDFTTIKKVDKNGITTTIAGEGTVEDYDGMPATVSSINATGLAIDAQDNLYVTCGWRFRIIKIDPQGIAHIIAGPKIRDSSTAPTISFDGDGGPATNAHFWYPSELAVDGIGNVYIDDGGNYRIRKINAQGIISTVIGGGTADPTKGGMAADGKWISTYAMVVDKHNNLYVGCYGSNIIKITPDGRVSLVAGGNDLGYTQDGTKAMGAKLGWIRGLAFDANGHLYFSEYDNHRVRMIDGLGLLRTVAGTGIDTPNYSGIGGPAIKATIPNPVGICFDKYDNLYISSKRNEAVYKVSK
jgi:hypothetical protein